MITIKDLLEVKIEKMEIIEVFKDVTSNFKQTVELEGVLVTITIYYNSFSEKWFMNIETGDQKLLSVKLVENFLLLDTKKTWISNIKGDFLVLKLKDISISDTLTYDNFGISWFLVYLYKTETELFKELVYGI